MKTSAYIDMMLCRFIGDQLLVLPGTPGRHMIREDRRTVSTFRYDSI